MQGGDQKRAMLPIGEKEEPKPATRRGEKPLDQKTPKQFLNLTARRRREGLAKAAKAEKKMKKAVFRCPKGHSPVPRKNPTQQAEGELHPAIRGGEKRELPCPSKTAFSEKDRNWW